MRNVPLVVAAALVGTPAVAKAPTIHVSGWARPTVAAQKAGAVYLTLHNAGPGGDRLLSVSTPVAVSASVHSTTTAVGVMRMRGVANVPIAANQRIAMKPGGLHVMLTGLRGPLRAGQKLPLTLRFQRAGLVRTSVPIQMTGISEDHGHHAH